MTCSETRDFVNLWSVVWLFEIWNHQTNDVYWLESATWPTQDFFGCCMGSWVLVRVVALSIKLCIETCHSDVDCPKGKAAPKHYDCCPQQKLTCRFTGLAPESWLWPLETIGAFFVYVSLQACWCSDSRFNTLQMCSDIPFSSWRSGWALQLRYTSRTPMRSCYLICLRMSSPIQKRTTDGIWEDRRPVAVTRKGTAQLPATCSFVESSFACRLLLVLLPQYVRRSPKCFIVEHFCLWAGASPRHFVLQWADTSLEREANDFDFREHIY